MLILRIVRAIAIVCARWCLFTLLAAICICVALFVTLLSRRLSA